MTTPDFEKMFDIDGFLNSDDQIRYAKAVRAFADAVENIITLVLAGTIQTVPRLWR
jgi:hypothetical protein